MRTVLSIVILSITTLSAQAQQGPPQGGSQQSLYNILTHSENIAINLEFSANDPVRSSWFGEARTLEPFLFPDPSSLLFHMQLLYNQWIDLDSRYEAGFSALGGFWFQWYSVNDEVAMYDPSHGQEAYQELLDKCNDLLTLVHGSITDDVNDMPNQSECDTYEAHVNTYITNYAVAPIGVTDWDDWLAYLLP